MGETARGSRARNAALPACAPDAGHHRPPLPIRRRRVFIHQDPQRHHREPQSRGARPLLQSMAGVARCRRRLSPMSRCGRRREPHTLRFASSSEGLSAVSRIVNQAVIPPAGGDSKEGNRGSPPSRRSHFRATSGSTALASPTMSVAPVATASAASSSLESTRDHQRCVRDPALRTNSRKYGSEDRRSELARAPGK